MKLLRFGPSGGERPGLVDGAGAIRDLGGVIGDLDGSALSPASLERLRGLDPGSLPLAPPEARIGACVARPGKFIGIGLNYADHAAETGAPIPTEPVIFMKATSCIGGPDDPIVAPRGAKKLDWEVELAFVVGKPALYLSEAEAAAAIAGYCICNDVSERAFQMERGGQWDKGKSCDSFGPIGPWLVTADEVGDPGALALWLEVNGRRFQNGSTATMIFKPAFLLAYLSRFMSLQPGDIVTTGTPAGVGAGQRPQVFLKAGDTVELEVEKLGRQRQRVVEAP
jgi:2,4-diketo-3-deoxy-L-fuconate hydrolase